MTTPAILSDFERQHAESILALEPNLVPIPPERVTRVLCGIPARKPAAILEVLYRTVVAQRCRSKVVLDVLFAPNFAPGDADRKEALAMLEKLRESGAIIVNNIAAPEGDYGQRSETRAWSKPAFERMARLKNGIIQYALSNDYDFLWLLDADVLCDPYTLQSMLDSSGHDQWLLDERRSMPVVSAVYWTRWQRPAPGTQDNVHAGPQVWLVHPYQLHGRGWTESDFRDALIRRQRVRVWGLGACTLVSRGALEHGLNFSHFDGLPPGGMAEGEDRHFCARANQLHIQMLADAWPDIYHAYHPEEYGEIDEQLEAMQALHDTRPYLGGLISARVELLEPVPDATGRLIRPAAQYVRGRLGALPVLPQLEETIASLETGESKLVKVAYPATYPDQQLRLKSVVMRVTLFDAKPFRIAPIIEREVFVGTATGRVIDHTQHSVEQLEEMVHG